MTHMLQLEKCFYVKASKLQDVICEAWQMPDYSLYDHFSRFYNYVDDALFQFKAEKWSIDEQTQHYRLLWSTYTESGKAVEDTLDLFIRSRQRGLTVRELLSIMATFGLIPAGRYVIDFEL